MVKRRFDKLPAALRKGWDTSPDAEAWVELLGPHVPEDVKRLSTERDGGYLLEVFLEPECGVATQRGYLRFVAQMADLAGEFLRADQLRRLRRGRELAANVDQAVATLHKIEQRKKLEAAIVDLAADMFGFDRVGLCAGTSPRLVGSANASTAHRAWRPSERWPAGSRTTSTTS